MSAKEKKEELPPQDKHAVVYTDGGCRPSRGIGGWGMHGYIFTHEVPKQGSGCKGGYPSQKGYINEDKAKRPDAPPVSLISYVDGWGSLIPESTNNEAELTAALNTFEWAIEQDIKTLHLKLDSQYVLDGITDWVYKWSKSNWVKSDGQPYANVELWKKLHEARVALEDKFVLVSYEWVKGHSGAIGNECADELATMGIVAGRKGIAHHEIVMSDAKGYWNSDADYNRMLSQSRWYFNTNVGGALKSDDGRWIYHLGDHGKDDELLGKRISDACFSIVYLKKPEPVLEIIRGYQDVVTENGYNSVVVGRIDKIMQGSTYNEILERGPLLMHRPSNSVDLYMADEQPITKEMRPPRLAFNAIESLTHLEGLLNDFLAAPETHKLVVTDLTDMLYDVTETGKKKVCKLKPTITNNTKSLEVMAGYDTGAQKGQAPVTLTVGIDTASRNTLAALAGLFPKVSMITWRESDVAIRYATIIEAGEDAGIWAGVYSNIRMLTP